MIENSRDQIILLLAVSLLIFLGFYLFYSGGVSLDSIISLNNELPAKMIGQQNMVNPLQFVFSQAGLFIFAVLAMVMFSLALALLSVRQIWGRIKYALAAPILLSGLLFNFSIMFLFFAFGLFVACLYVMPLGETYYQELKKWRSFRVGSNAVGKALFVMFLIIFVGSYIALSNEAYKEKFSAGLEESVSGIVQNEAKNVFEQQNSPQAVNEAVGSAMKQIRTQNPGLTEEQYAQMETSVRGNFTAQTEYAYEESKQRMNGVVKESLESSPIIGSLKAWFPLMFSFTIWATLEFLRAILFAPVAGIFSYIFLRIFPNADFGGGDGDSEKIPLLELKIAKNS